MWGATQDWPSSEEASSESTEEAARPAQARASQNHAEPRVSCFGRPRPQAGKLGQTAREGRPFTQEAVWAQATGERCPPLNYHTIQPGRLNRQAWSKRWRRGIPEINVHARSEKQTKIWCKTIWQQGLASKAAWNLLELPPKKGTYDHTQASEQEAALKCYKQGNDTP